VSVPLSIRLPDETADALDDLAASTSRSKSYYVIKALNTFLAEYADHQIALDRMMDKDDPIISISEMRQQIASED